MSQPHIFDPDRKFRRDLLPPTPPAAPGTPGLVMPDGETIIVDESGRISVRFAVAYELCEFYHFRNPVTRAGFQPCNGGVITKADSAFPKAWAYLQTAARDHLCLSEADWQSMSTAWNGIGGVPWFVINTGAKTLRLPDLRGMYMEGAGFDGLVAGGVHKDAIRNITGHFGACVEESGADVGGAFYIYGSGPGYEPRYADYRIAMSADRVVPTANVNRPRAWGALACVYLGGQ